MYEHRIVLGSLVGGMAGYGHFERRSWLVAVFNAATLLGVREER